MAKTKREFIVISCFTSGIAVILSLVSLGTQQWVVAEGRFTAQAANDKEISNVYYGLFAGVYEQNFPGSIAYEITMTCLVAENVCAMLCSAEADGRILELENLYNNRNVTFNQSCPKVQRNLQNLAEVNTPRQYINDTRDTKNPKEDKEFINAGCYLSTLVFLCIAQVCGLLSTGLAVWNSGGNPIYSLFNILGLFIYNGIAAVSLLIVLVIWGLQYEMTIISNACILNSISGKMDTWSNLGFSYWINLGSLLLYCISIILLYIRRYQIEREPHIKEEIDEDHDVGMIIMY